MPSGSEGRKCPSARTEWLRKGSAPVFYVIDNERGSFLD